MTSWVESLRCAITWVAIGGAACRRITLSLYLRRSPQWPSRLPPTPKRLPTSGRSSPRRPRERPVRVPPNVREIGPVPDRHDRARHVVAPTAAAQAHLRPARRRGRHMPAQVPWLDRSRSATRGAAHEGSAPRFLLDREPSSPSRRRAVRRQHGSPRTSGGAREPVPDPHGRAQHAPAGASPPDDRFPGGARMSTFHRALYGSVCNTRDTAWPECTSRHRQKYWRATTLCG